jgi:hypothetical protein
MNADAGVEGRRSTVSETKPDCYEYVRRTYGVPAYVGVRVRETRGGREGVLVRARSDLHYVHIKFDGAKFAVNAHPTDELQYLVEAVSHG